MSFILDALKKSEAERQRQSGPDAAGGAHHAAAAPLSRLGDRVGALLARQPAAAAGVHAAPAGAPTRRARAGARRGAGSGRGIAASRSGGTCQRAHCRRRRGAAVVSRRRHRCRAPTVGADRRRPRAAQSGRPATRRASMARTVAGNPADDEPAVPPGAPRAARARQRRPLRQSAELQRRRRRSAGAAAGPARVSARRARDRYALINMHRVREGDVLPEGPRVLAITREGVALDYRGQDFMLRPQ